MGQCFSFAISEKGPRRTVNLANQGKFVSPDVLEASIFSERGVAASKSDPNSPEKASWALDESGLGKRPSQTTPNLRTVLLDDVADAPKIGNGPEDSAPKKRNGHTLLRRCFPPVGLTLMTSGNAQPIPSAHSERHALQEQIRVDIARAIEVAQDRIRVIAIEQGAININILGDLGQGDDRSPMQIACDLIAQARNSVSALRAAASTTSCTDAQIREAPFKVPASADLGAAGAVGAPRSQSASRRAPGGPSKKLSSSPATTTNVRDPVTTPPKDDGAALAAKSHPSASTPSPKPNDSGVDENSTAAGTSRSTGSHGPPRGPVQEAAWKASTDAISDPETALPTSRNVTATSSITGPTTPKNDDSRAAFPVTPIGASAAPAHNAAGADGQATPTVVTARQLIKDFSVRAGSTSSSTAAASSRPTGAGAVAGGGKSGGIALATVGVAASVHPSKLGSAAAQSPGATSVDGIISTAAHTPPGRGTIPPPVAPREASHSPPSQQPAAVRSIGHHAESPPSGAGGGIAGPRTVGSTPGRLPKDGLRSGGGIGNGIGDDWAPLLQSRPISEGGTGEMPHSAERWGLGRHTPVIAASPSSFTAPPAYSGGRESEIV